MQRSSASREEISCAPLGRTTVLARIDTPNELDDYRRGGILQYVLRQLAKA
jgi:aconitase A